MNDVRVTYKFSRNALTSFLKENRASTDAIGLLVEWKAKVAARDYEVHRDDGDGVTDEDTVIATLSTTHGDAECHRGEIDTLCARFGLSREVLPSP